MSISDEETENLVRRGRAGDPLAVDELFERYRDRLERMARIRLDPRLRGRLDPAYAVQEAYLEALRRLPNYLETPTLPFFLWLRSILGQKLVDLHRHHLGAKARDPRREVAAYRVAMPEATSAILAAQLLGTLTTPSEIVAEAEARAHVQAALDSMDAIDRDVLVLRHFEQLSNAEAAEEIGIKESAASNRYVRALTRLRKALADLPGGLEGLR